LAIAWDTRHPWRDKTGANAFRGQSGPLWFLGGGVATRQVVVPDDRWLYVSIAGVGSRVLTLQIADVAAGYRFGPLLDNPSQSWVELSKSAPDVRVTVRRVGYPEDTTGSVRFATEDGTATAGQDYEAVSGTLDFTPVSGQLTFTPDVTSREVRVSNLNDTVADGPKTLRFELYDPVGDVPIASAFVATTIYDNEIGYGSGGPFDAYTGWPSGDGGRRQRGAERQPVGRLRNPQHGGQ
jgi:hypothetical protein